MPEVSVIIPLYNKGPHIARTLCSVFGQTWQEFEVIVVDGGSTDNGTDIVRGFEDPRLRLVMQRGKGVSEARNQGIDIAKADLITFLDADDEWTPSHLETILRLRKKFPEAGLYATAFKIHAGGGKVRAAKYREIPDAPWEGLIPDYFKAAALGDSPVLTSAAGIPMDVLARFGGFAPGCPWGEDHDLFGRIALKYPVAFSREPGAIYHTEAVNRATRLNLAPDCEEPFVKNARSALNRGEVPPRFREPLDEYIYRKELMRAEKNVVAGNCEAALSILKRCDTKWHKKMKLKWYIMAKLPCRAFSSLLTINGKLKKGDY